MKPHGHEEHEPTAAGQLHRGQASVDATGGRERHVARFARPRPPWEAHAEHHEEAEVGQHRPHGNGHEQHPSHGGQSAPEREDHLSHAGHQEHAGHDQHAGHGGHGGHGGPGGHGDHVGQFRRLFWIMLVLAVPVVAASSMFAMVLGYELPDVPGLGLVSPVLGTVMYVWGGRPFLTGAVSEIRARKTWMMLLIGLAITVAFVASWGASLGLLDHQLDFWWELALLIVIMLLGHWIEMRSLAQTTSALDSLAALLPDEAERVEGDEVITVAPADLRVGDVVVVRPGGRVPADGKIVDGAASMDESMITGESRTVRRSSGELVVAGTVATDSGLRVEVTAVGQDTALAGIQRLVTEAQSSSSRAQRLADTAAGWLFWFALRCRGAHRRDVDRPRAARRRGDPDGDRARHRLPARAGPGHSARGVHRDRACRPRRCPDQGPARAGEHAHRRCRAVRQDRHPDQGRAHRDRDRAHRRPRRGHRPRPGGSSGVRLRAPARPGHRPRRAREEAVRPAPLETSSRPRQSVFEPPSRAATSRSAGPTCCTSDRRRSCRSPISGAPRAPSSCTS